MITTLSEPSYVRQESSKDNWEWTISSKLGIFVALFRLGVLGSLVWMLVYLVMSENGDFREKMFEEINEYFTGHLEFGRGYAEPMVNLVLIFLVGAGTLTTLVLLIEPKTFSRKSRVGLSKFPWNKVWNVVWFPFLGYVSVMEVLMVVVWLAAQCYPMYQYYDNRKERFLSRGREFTTASALMAACRMFGVGLAINGTLLLIPICKHSFWLQFFDVGFERVVKFHRLLGHLVVWFTVLHVVLGALSYHDEGRFMQCFGWSDEVDEGSTARPCSERLVKIIIHGQVAFFAGVILYVTSLPIVRRWSYQLFYYCHFMAIPFLIFGAVHDMTLFRFVLPGFISYVVDKIISAARQSQRCSVVQAMVMGDCTRLVIAVSPQTKVRYGHWFFLHIYKAARLEWHPMSVSAVDEVNNTITFDIRGSGNWSKNVQKCVSNNQVEFVRLNGPFGGSHFSFSGYTAHPSVLFVSGGIGITAHLAAARKTVEEKQHKFVGLLWMVPSVAMLEMQKPLLEEMKTIGGHRVEIKVFLTRELDLETSQGPVFEKLGPSNTNGSVLRRFHANVQHPLESWFLLTCTCFAAMFGVWFSSEWIERQEESRELEFDLQRGVAIGFCLVFASATALVISLISRHIHRFRFRNNLTQPEQQQQSLTPTHDTIHDNDKVTTASGIDILRNGRPDMSKELHHFQQQCKLRQASTVGLTLCGPQKLIQTVRKVVKSINNKDVTFIIDEEEFTF